MMPIRSIAGRAPAAVPACALIAALALSAAPALAVATLYGVDPYHSQIILLVDHFGVARSGGMIGGLGGTIEFDPNEGDEWKIDVTIPVFNFISTHGPRTEAVKGDQFLDATNHPEIKFSCTKMEKKDDAFVATGDLMIRGVTKEVTFPLVLRGPRPDPLGQVRLGLEGELVVSRSAFGLPFNRKMPDDTPSIGDEVTILFQIEAIKAHSGTRKPE